MKLKYTSIYSDADGVSHFKDAEMELNEAVIIPNTSPVNISAFFPAIACAFLTGSPGQFINWHKPEQRQFIIWLAGHTEICTSDSDTRTFGPGDFLLAEETTGKGHTGQLDSSVSVVNLVIQLAN